MQGADISKALCACDKLVSVVEMRPIYTGVINALDNVCAGCLSHAKGLSALVCRRCRKVVARVAPHKDKLGFQFVANRYYHITHCPACRVEGEEADSTIVEQYLHHRALGMRK
jgi:hypothetical protein